MILVCLLVALGLAKLLYDDRDDYGWSDLEELAAQVEKVTPPGKTLYADEQIYFLLHRTPPSGHELHDSHKLEFPPERAALLHVIPQSVLDKQIQAGQFDTIASCQDEEWNDARHLGDLYGNGGGCRGMRGLLGLERGSGKIRLGDDNNTPPSTKKRGRGEKNPKHGEIPHRGV